MSSEPRLWDEREERLVRFLLGDLPDGEREEIADRLFEDRAFLAEIQAAGDDLIHAYLTDSLGSADRARFETHFLASPRRRERFEFLRDVVSTVQQRSAGPRRSTAGRAWVLAAAVVILAVTALWRVVLVRPGQNGPGPIVTHPRTPVPTRPTAPPEETRVVRLPAPSQQPVEIAIPVGTRLVRLEVPIDDDEHPTFAAALRTHDGTTAWEAKRLVPPGPGLAVVLIVPAEILTADEYVLQVEGERWRDATPQKGVALKYRLRVARSR